MEPIRGFKGFNQDMTCKNFQFKEGEEYTEKNVSVCKSGFHFCAEPLDVLAYYDPANSVFHHVEGSGKSQAHDQDSKIVVEKIKIGARIGIAEFIKIGINVILKRTKVNEIKNSGDSSAAVNSGYRSAAVNSGDRSAAVNSGYSSAAVNSGYSSAAVNSGDSSAAVNSGYSSAAEVTGKNSIACGLGYNNKAKASIGSWLILTEWDSKTSEIKNVKSFKVDGKKIMTNTWYQLKRGRLVKSKL